MTEIFPISVSELTCTIFPSNSAGGERVVRERRVASRELWVEHT